VDTIVRLLAKYFGMCSASVISLNNRDLLVTAAHCIFDMSQGGFLVNHQRVFVPGYHNGQRPHGTFYGWTESWSW
jgi:V8-like Glu-specific endopeptidase